jgi:hypothetical protein
MHESLRLSLALTTVALFSVAELVSPAAAQGSGSRGRRESAAPSKPTKAWTPPKTAWGDPDLSGVYTDKYEQRTPMERPAELAGKRIEDITRDELEDIVQERQRQTIARQPFAGGDPEGRIGYGIQWTDMLSVHGAHRPWFVTEPSDGHIPPVTREAQQRIVRRNAAAAAARAGRSAADSYEDRSLYDRCITRGLPGSMLPSNYGNSFQIVQSPGRVAIIYEMIHETRVIPLDGSPHVGKGLRLEMGDARGLWDGNTLVVETTNFTERGAYRNADPDTLRLVERFTRTAPNTVEWAVTLDDPQTWTRPWTFSLPLTMDAREPVYEYACHEGNYAIPNILSAARAEEAARRPK